LAIRCQTTPHHVAEQRRPHLRDNFLSVETQAAPLLKAQVQLNLLHNARLCVVVTAT